MAVSVRAPNADLVSADVLVDGKSIPDVYFLHSLEVVNAINRIPYATVSVADGSPVEETFEASESAVFVPGKTIDVRAGYHGRNKQLFKGVIVRHGIRIDVDGKSYLVLTCYDPALRTTLSRSSLQFHDTTDSAAISKLLSDAGLKPDVQATSTQYEHQVMKYASAWDFILCRAEANGYVVTVYDGTVTVRPPKFDAAKLVAGFGDTIGELDLEIDSASQLPDVTSAAWDPKTQKVVSGKSSEPTVNKQGNLTGSKLSAALDQKSLGLQTQSWLETDELKTWANAQLLKSRLSRIRGTVSIPGNAEIKPGELLDLTGLGKRFNGAGYVSAVRHRVADGQWITELGFGLTRHWFSDTHRDVTAPPAAALRPSTGGLQIGTVKQIEDDPKGERRILVVLPLDQDGTRGIWVRFASPYATKNAGIEFLPEVGDEVVLGFLNDDPDSPIVLGALHSSARPSPVVPDKENKIKAIVSNTQMKISFDDVDKILTIETPGGHVVTLSDKDKSVTVTDSNSNKLEMSESGVTLSSPKDVTIKANGSVSIKGSSGVTVSSPADVSVKGAGTTVEAQMALTAKGGVSAELSSSGNTTVRGTMVMIN